MKSNMKKISSLILSLVCLLTFIQIPAFAASEATVYTQTDSSNKNVYRGMELTYGIYMSGTYDGFSMTVPEQGDTITVTNVTTASNNINADNNANGWLISVLGGLGKTDSGKEKIADISIKISDTAEFGNVELAVADLFVTSDTGDMVATIKESYETLTITEKPKENFTGLSIEDKTVTYDGTAQKIEVVGAPADATVKYTYAKAEDIVDEAIDAGTYTVTATVSKDGYNNWEDTATLTINKAALTLDGVEVANKVYDGTVEATVAKQGTVAGLAEADKNDEGKFTYGVHSASFADKNVGTDKAVSLEVDYKGTSAGNYTMTAPTNVTADITAKPITVTAADVTVKVGTKVDDIAKLLKYDVEGLVGDDKLTGTLAVDGKVDFSKVGEYDIVKGDLVAGANYDLTFVGAKLKVIDKTPQTITVAPVDAKTYGDAAFALTVTADETSELNAFKYASSDEKVATVDANGQVTIVGAGKTEITVKEPGNADYAAATATVTITVAPKTITVTAVNLDAKTATFAAGGILEADLNDVKVDFGRLKTTVESTTTTGETDVKTVTTLFKVSNIKLTGEKAANYTVSAEQQDLQYTSETTTTAPTPEEGKNTITSVTVGDTVIVPAIAVAEETVKIEAPKAVTMPKTVFNSITTSEVPFAITLKDGDTKKGSIELNKDALAAINTASDSASIISVSMKDIVVDDLVPAQQTKVAEFDAKTPVVYSLSIVNESGDSLASSFGENGKATVELPYTKPAGNGNVKVMLLKDDGTTEPVASTYENGFVKVELRHFSEYVVYTEPEVIVTTGGGSASTYTVKFNTNGGSVIKSVSVNKNDVVAEPTAPTKKGYTFDGWYTDRQLTTPYDFTSKVTKNFTLFAKWVEDNEEPGTDEPGTEEPTTVSFDDINETDWFYESVQYVVDNKLMNGVSDTEFAPNNTLTRAMLVTVLYRNAGEPEVTEDASFADVDADAWYAKAVVWAEANGIVNGVSDTEFAPNANITREQIATIMYRYAQYNGDDVTAVADIEAYADATNVSDYAVDAMKYAVGSGLINGKTETTLNPQDNATRAEIATILKRFIEANAVVENPAEGTTEETTEEAVEETTEETVEETTEETAE